MTIPLAVDAEGAVQAWFQSRFPAVRVVTELPNQLEAALPVYKVLGLGGPMKLSLTTARMEVQAFGADRRTARQLAVSALSAARRELPGQIVNSVAFVSVQVTVAPHVVEYDNPNVRRAVVEFDVVCHPAP